MMTKQPGTHSSKDFFPYHGARRANGSLLGRRLIVGRFLVRDARRAIRHPTQSSPQLPLPPPLKHQLHPSHLHTPTRQRLALSFQPDPTLQLRLHPTPRRNFRKLPLPLPLALQPLPHRFVRHNLNVWFLRLRPPLSEGSVPTGSLMNNGSNALLRAFQHKDTHQM